jgi:benzoyl-CoA 2,3-dioxygenase component B
MSVDYSERIPNNVRLSEDRRLQRALEAWQPRFLDWWKELGPEGFQDRDVYLRTATSVDAEGWATYGWLKMPEYRWGIFLAEQTPDRTIGFGDHVGQPVWHEVPGEFRAPLRRLIVTQGDTEPASVEQLRLLGQTAPSLYDLRSLFQVNVEEGRHLWAMVYLLHAYFGRDGREEAEGLLERRSGDVDNPRILGTFNEPIPDWLSWFCFGYFTDRDGKYQLKGLAESAFDPLARTCRFMLTEEAYHMSVGQLGLARIVRRTCQVMNELKTDDPAAVRAAGAIDLPTIQRHLNFWCSSSLDLFGSELSTNAATAFANGLKGRPDEIQFEDHICRDSTLALDRPTADGEVTEDAPTRNAMNEIMRRAYLSECEIGIKLWNRIVQRAGLDYVFSLPSHRFNRRIGLWQDQPYDPAGRRLPVAEWQARQASWLPSADDRAFVRALMKPVTEPGKMAGWIAPPERGVNNLAPDHEYVRL